MPIKLKKEVKKPTKKKLVVDDVVVDNPEEITIEAVVTTNDRIIPTGKVNKGKKEFKNLDTQTTFYI